MEPDPLYAVWKLFLVGVMSQSLFSMTRNLLTIWPLFHAVGVLLDFAVNIDGVEQVVGDFPWAVGTVIAMAIVVGVLALISAREVSQKPGFFSKRSDKTWFLCPVSRERSRVHLRICEFTLLYRTWGAEAREWTLDLRNWTVDAGRWTWDVGL